MFYRCELLIDGLRYRVTDDLENWDEVKASFKRSDYDGVIRTFSNKFSFARGARGLLLKQYDEKYLNASASIIISTRNNSWLYNEQFNCALNFSTLQDNGHILQINAVDDSVASMIKAKKGTQYEYPVEEMRSTIPLVYDGLELSESAKWIPTGDTLGDNDELINVYFSKDMKPMPIYITASDTLIKGALEFNDQTIGGDDIYAMKALKSVSVNLDFNFSMFVFRKFQSGVLGYDIRGVRIQILKKGNSVNEKGESVITETVIGAFELTTESETPVEKTVSESYDISLLHDDRIIVRAMYVNEGSGITSILPDFQYKVSTSSYFKASWKNRINPVEMDLVSPEALLNRVLKSINDEKDGLTGVIESEGDRRLDNCMILAAESARKIPGAQIYTSFTKFANWMSYVFGYAYDISGNTITFRHRSKYFSNDVVKRIGDLSGYEMKVNSALVYSRLRIGFDKQDYDTANGKDEFRFANEYTTGVNMTDNSLEMISPYRADAYGIEFLADKIGEDTTDDESDTDLFMVGVKLNSSGTKYILDRDYIIGGVLSPSTMFNTMYSPSSMVVANEGYIGSSVGKLTFASSEGNSDVGIDGMGENRDIVLLKNLFTVAEVEFETSDVELPEDLTGIVEFEHQGKVIQGYYQQADYNFTKSQSSKVTLIVKKSNSI